MYNLLSNTFFRLYFVLLLAELTFYCHTQSLPEYWKGKVGTTENGTSNKPVPFKFFASNTEYNKKDSARDLEVVASSNLLSLDENKRNPTNTAPVNKTGTEHTVTLVEGLITSLEVLDHYNYDGTGAVPVKFSTSWLKVDTVNSKNHTPYLLEESMWDNGLLNITLRTSWFGIKPSLTQKINDDRYWEIDEYLCYYAGTTVDIVNGKCVLQYMEVIRYFIELWQLNFVNPIANAVRDKVSNNYDYLKTYKCAEIPGERTCLDKKFEKIFYIPSTDVWLPPIFEWYRFDAKPAGIGHAVNITFGYNKTKGAYDLNFTVIFNEWTNDLPDGLLSSFRDFKFNFEDFKLEISYWVEDPEEIPERPIPGSFWIICIIMIFPFTVLVLGVILLIFTRTKKSFRLNLWEYWKSQKGKGMTTSKLEEQKEEKLIEMADIRKEKEWSEFEKGMGK